MIVPGKDDNYPGGAIGVPGTWNFMPHTVVGLLLVFIILFIGWHLLAGPKRRR